MSTADYESPPMVQTPEILSGTNDATSSDTNIHSFAAFVLGSACLAGLILAIGHSGGFTWTAPAPIYLGICPLQFSGDHLTSVFLFLLFSIGLVTTIFSPGYLSRFKTINAKLFWTCQFLFVISMGGVLTASNAVTFLVFWEIMSLSSGALVAIENSGAQSSRAAIIYLGATRIATALLAAGFLWAHQLFNDWSFSAWHLSSLESTGAAVLILLGFAIKAGLWPFHIWLPYAHPAAPAPVSALMSGVMIKLAIYGMLRLFAFEAHAPTLIIVLLIALGTVSSGWGVLFGLVQRDLKRILAYSSVENIGLITLALGLFLYGKSSGLPLVAQLSFCACLFHCVNHGIFKSLLFLGAGAVDASTHTRDLNHLGGLSQRMPWTMICFLIGSAAISALVPLNGFASKWLIYQGLFHAALESKNILHACVAIFLIGWLVLVGGLSIACFTRAFGVAFLGRARTKAPRSARECTPPMVAAQFSLVVACLVAGLASPTISTFLAAIHPGKLLPLPQLPVSDFGFLFLALPVFLYLLLLKGHKITKFWTWECGYGSLTSHMQTTAESFAQPIASLVSPILQYSLKAEITGADRRHFPERIKAEAVSRSLLEQRVYGPLVQTVQAMSSHIARLQAGSVHLYLLYLLLTVISLVLVGVMK